MASSDTADEVYNSLDLSGLSEDKLRNISHFKELSGLVDDDSAKRLLEDSDWNLEQAVHAFFGLGDQEAEVRRRNVTDNPAVIELAPINQRIYRAHAVPNTWLNTFFSYLLSPFQSIYNVLYDILNFLIPYVWPNSRRHVTDAPGNVREFIATFRHTYVTPQTSTVNVDQSADAVEPQNILPPFYVGSYGEALQEAKSSLRFLIIYLHGDSHEDTDVFCRKTLLDPATLIFLSNTELIIFWGCNINSSEGNRVSQILQENTYPFIGVVGLSGNPAYSSTSFGSSTRMALLGRIEGLISPSDLITQLQAIIDDHEAILLAARADRHERNLSTQLRNEQDQAYADSLAVDRAKAAEREAKVARLTADAEAEKKLEALDKARVRRQQRWARDLPVPPILGTPDTVRLSTILPNGDRQQRIFPIKDSLKHLYYFTISQEGAPFRFAVESNFPKRIIECKPETESDLEDYLVENDSSISQRHESSIDFTPGDSDPPSFEAAHLTKPELLFVINLDS